MSDPSAIDARRRRLKFRSWHRGTKESDLILGRFADAHLDGFDAARLDLYENLIEESDPDIYNWLTGREPPPPHHDHDVLKLIQRFNATLPND